MKGEVDYGSINDGGRGGVSSPLSWNGGEGSSSWSDHHQSPATARRRQQQQSWWWNRHPALVPAVSFALLMLVGTIVANIRSGDGSSSRSASSDLLASLTSSGDASFTAAAKIGKKKLTSALAAVPYVNNTGRSYSSTQRFYTAQPVDHFDRDSTATWAHRYYAKKKHWKGPGHPIFLLIGGEGGNEVGFFYGFIDKVLAKKFGAFCLHPEHRFYGRFRPVENATAEQLAQLLTPEQAMMDMIEIVQHYRKKLGCSMVKGHKEYCPVITVGGSYPGFLSAMMRFLYPDIIDIGYASSAPLKLYSHQVDQWGYYDIVTEASDRVSPGCAAATKQALTEADQIIRNTPDFATLATERLGICPGSIPGYIDNSALFSEELMQVVETTFADADMVGNYPPSNQTWLARLCHVFQQEGDGVDSLSKVKDFWKELEIQDDSVDCFRMNNQLPEGFNATLSGADWTGEGPGLDGTMWGFQCCYSLLPDVGFSEESMFPYRKWTYEWLTEHCMNRFGMVGTMMGMVDKWHFDDLVGQGASRIVFTNGLNDIWMHGGITEDLSESLISIVMQNGGHHSEVYAKPNDTPDIREGQAQIARILSEWLRDIKKGE